MELLPMSAEVAKWEPSSAAAVIEQLELARTWLREASSLNEVAPVLPQAEAIRVLVHKRDLGREAELAAAEIVRRVERRLAELIREGQEDGTVRVAGQSRVKRDRDGMPTLISSADIFRNDARRDAFLMATFNDDDFDEAVAAARAEGNMSRAAVMRKLRGTPAKLPPSPRGEWHRGKRHLDPRRIVTESIAALEGVASGLELIEPDVVEPADAREWSKAMRAATSRIEAWRRGMVTP